MITGSVPGVALLPTILSAVREKRNGFLHFDIENGVRKSIRFWRGQIVFARSSLIDDRLGEVIYRAGAVSLDEFTDMLSMVNEGAKLGEVFVQKGQLKPIDVWKYLQLQTEEIVTSLSLWPSFHIGFEEIKALPENDLSCQFDILTLLQEAEAEKVYIDQFYQSLSHTPCLNYDSNRAWALKNEFQRDLASLVESFNDAKKIIEKESRMHPLYTVRELYRLYLMGVFKTDYDEELMSISLSSYKSLLSVVDDGKYIFAEIKSQLKKEFDDATWLHLIQLANRVLEDEVGDGCFMDPEEGFISKNLIRVFILRKQTSSSIISKIEDYWPDPLVNRLEYIVHATMLYLLFEMGNLKQNVEVISKLRLQIDSMKNEDYSQLANHYQKAV